LNLWVNSDEEVGGGAKMREGRFWRLDVGMENLFTHIRLRLTQQYKDVGVVINYS